VIVLRRFVRDRRRSIAGWSVGVGLYILSNNAIFPSIKKIKGIEDMMKNLPKGLRSAFGSSGEILITSPAGYQQGRLFSLVLPILVVIFAVSVGTHATSGSEEEGTLELLLANPVSRERVLLERFGGLVACTFALGGAMTAILVAFSPPFGLLDGVSIVGLLAACAGVTLVGLLHGTLAFTIGAWTGKRSVAIASATSVAAAGYLLNALAETSEKLHLLRFITPWHWFLGRNMLAQGVAPDALLLPIAVCAVLVGAAYWRFPRRDLR